MITNVKILKIEGLDVYNIKFFKEDGTEDTFWNIDALWLYKLIESATVIKELDRVYSEYTSERALRVRELSDLLRIIP